MPGCSSFEVGAAKNSSPFLIRLVKFAASFLDGLLLIEAGFQLTPKQKDRLSAEIDFKVNLKSELMLEELTRRMERLQNEQIEELLNLMRLTQMVKEHIEEHHAEKLSATTHSMPSVR